MLADAENKDNKNKDVKKDVKKDDNKAAVVTKDP